MYCIEIKLLKDIALGYYKLEINKLIKINKNGNNIWKCIHKIEINLIKQIYLILFL